MYRSFFGLKELPFKISPDLSFFYKQASREEIVEALLYSILRGDGIVKVVGEVGAGKTMLLRMLVEKLPEHYQKIYISSPNLSPIDFLKFICSELQIGYTASDTKHDLVKRLNAYLIQAYSNGKRVIMLVDEAQSMTLDTLEEVRLLGNLETETDKLLQMVLFGQPELDVTLNDVRVKPLKDRIANQMILPALSPQEVLTYLNYRMRVAGRLEVDVFTPLAAERIWQLTKGYPRAINLLADKLLMAAFSTGDTQIAQKHFKAIGETRPGFKGFGSLAKTRYWVAMVVGVSLSLGLMSFVWQGSRAPVQKPVEMHSTMSIAELSEVSHASEKTIKQLYRLNMDAFAYIHQLSGKQSVLLLSQDEINHFQQQFSELMAGLKANQKNRVYVLLNLKPGNKRYESLTFYDVAGMSVTDIQKIQNQFLRHFPALTPKILTVNQLKTTL